MEQARAVRYQPYRGQPPQQQTWHIPPPRAPRPIAARGRQVYKPQTPTNNTYHPEGQNADIPPLERPSRRSTSTGTSSTTSLSSTKGKIIKEYDPTPTSRYIHMLLSVDTIPKIYNLLAAFFTWILLAGYVLLPGTFTKIGNKLPDPDSSRNDIEKWILDTVKNTPLLYIATTCSVVGIIGMASLWMKWRKNYVWIINRIFLPGALNSLAGIISTIVNVHTAQDGKYSLTAIVSITITATSTLINTGLWYVYNNWALARVQEMHRREYFERTGKVDIGDCELGESGKLVEVDKK